MDDEADMRAYLHRLLRTHYHVVTAPNGDDGLDCLHDERPDLVISDVAMPEMDGIELCRAIRSDDALHTLPVLLLTARGEAELHSAGIEAGADAYVPKPFDPSDLKARIENLIEICRLVQERAQVPDWLEPTSPSLESEEADFLESLTSIVDEHIDNSNFGVDWLAD